MRVLARFNPETRRLTVFDDESRMLGFDVVSYTETPADALARLGWQQGCPDDGVGFTGFRSSSESIADVVPFAPVAPAPVSDLGWAVVPTPTQIKQAVLAVLAGIAGPRIYADIESVLTERGFLA